MNDHEVAEDRQAQADYAEARAQELLELMRQQAADDTNYQRPQEFGGARTQPLDSADDLDSWIVDGYDLADDVASMIDGEAVNEVLSQAAAAPYFVPWWLGDAPAALQETYQLVFGGGMTHTEAATEMNISRQACDKRVDRIKALYRSSHGE